MDAISSSDQKTRNAKLVLFQYLKLAM